MRTKIVLWSLATLLTLTLIGCGSGSITTLPTPAATLMSIAVSPSTPTVAIGTTQQFSAKGSYSDGTTQDITSSVTWSSSSAGIATINSDGLATLVGAGKATITAELKSVKGDAGLTVTDNLTAISVEASQTSMFIGGSQQLTAMGTYQDKKPPVALAGVTWTSSAPGIVSITSGGVVTAVAAGSATIDATLSSVKGSLPLQVSIVVLQSITLGPAPANVNVGSTQQLTATGHYDNGTQQNISSSVSWTISNTSLATISNAGLASGVHGGTVTVKASQGSISAFMQMSVTALLSSISVAPVGPAILVGGNQQFSATGFYNDGTSQNLTSTASWTSSNQTKATITGGIASGVAVGSANIAASLSGVSGTTSLDVVASQYANLLGPWAFSLGTTNSRPSMFAGSITFDGAGNISGIEDSNTATGVNGNVTVSGTYVLYPDGRGNIVISANACHPSGITLRFILDSTGTDGKLIEFDGAGTVMGTMKQQNSAAFNAAAIDGTYVFSASGVDASTNVNNIPEGLAEAGMFAADGLGDITAGVDDVNDYGVFNGDNPLSASSYSVNTNGRGTLQLISGASTTNYAIYIVDSTEMFFVETDTGTVTAVAGEADLQTAQTYSSVTGNFAFLVKNPVLAQQGQNTALIREAQVGQFQFSAGNLGGIRNGDGLTGGYIISEQGVNGRGQINATDTYYNQEYTYFYYMVSPSKMVLLQTNWWSNLQEFSPALGEADLQVSTPYGTSTLAGNYALQAFNLNGNAAANMLMNFDGAGDISGIVDMGAVGSVTSVLLGDPFYVYTPDNLGSTNISMTTPAGTENYFFYLYAPQSAWMGGQSTPLAGNLTQQ